MQARQMPDPESSDLSLDGLEDLLDNGSELPGSQQDFSVEEAAKSLGLSRGAIIRRLEDGILRGYKIRRPYGLVWRVNDPRVLGSWARSSSKADGSAGNASKVNPRIRKSFEQIVSHEDAEQLSTNISNADQENLEQIKPGDLQDLPFVEVSDVELNDRHLPMLASEFDLDLVELRTKLEMAEFQFQDTLHKLEQAQYKIGYLEARLENSQEQVRLLTDERLHQPWWRRWSQWFKTVR